MVMNGLIQIAGIHDSEEAALLQSCGVRFLGFPLRLPVHQADLSEVEAAHVIQALQPAYHAVLITYLDQADEITALCEMLGVSIVQLHGDIEIAELQALKRKAPHLKLIKSLVVRADNTGLLEHDVVRFSPHVHAFITDTFDPVTGASGATGKTHDWSVSRRLVMCSPLPVILAGGLDPDNVYEAILTVRPAGVDVHTGVEGSDGRKMRGLVEQFVTRSREGFAVLEPSEKDRWSTFDS